MADYHVSLPMYDWPEQQPFNDQFWELLKTQLHQSGIGGLPASLSRGEPMGEWLHPQTLLSQTCGYPLVHILKDQVQLIGTPGYAVPLCRNGYYASAVLVRRDDSSTHVSQYRHRRIAINSQHSQSGCHALLNAFHAEKMLSDGQFESTPLETGSHRASIRAVAEQSADLCAVDPLSWDLAKRYEPSAESLHTIGTTPYTPSLPLVCSRHLANNTASDHGMSWDEFAHTLRTCWVKAIAADTELARQTRMDGIFSIKRATYEAVPAFSRSG